ncbi:MAG: DUF1631 family protein [Pseudomonadota bacterium]|nr:DUF1631 family protein [Pseudomonadota bacterium]
MNANSDFSTLIPKLTQRARDMMGSAFELALKKARDPEFRSDPNADNMYARYDALDAFSAHYEFVHLQAVDTLLGGLVKESAGESRLADLDDTGGLSLVGADAMDLAVASTRGIQKANETYRELLLHLELRLQELALLSGARIEPMGIHPEKIYKAIEQALSAMDLETESKLILFGLLDGYVACEIEAFYQAVNQLLIDGDILAADHLMRHALKARDAANSVRMPTGTYPQIPAERRPGDTATSTLEQAGPGNTWAGQDSGIYPGSGGVLAGTGAGTVDAGALGALRSYIAGEPAVSGEPAGQAPQAPAGGQTALFSAVASTRPVVRALTAVQHHEMPQGVPLAAEEIKGQLASAYSESAEDGDTWKITESEERVIDFVSQIFQGLFEDNSVSDAIKALISRLQIPIIKLALIDFNFFQRPDHPARQVLNELVQIGIGLEDRDDPLFFRLQSIVEAILADFDTDTRPFEDALRKLAELTARDTSEAEENEVQTRQEAVREARRSAAKRHVISTVNHFIHKKEVPDEGIQFILKCWAPYMGMLYLREGKDSKHWEEAVGALRHIIEAVQPERTHVEVEALIGRDETFFDEISGTLSESAILHENQEDILSHFRGWFHDWVGNLWKKESESREAAVVEGAEVPEDLPEPRIEDLLPKVDPNAGEPENLLKDLLERIPAEVKPGSWFEIYRGEDHAKRRLKLSTILEDTGKLLFADRSGRGALEVELEGFLEDLREGRSALIEETSRFDRALSAVITNIRDNNLQHSTAA